MLRIIGRVRLTVGILSRRLRVLRVTVARRSSEARGASIATERWREGGGIAWVLDSLRQFEETWSAGLSCRSSPAGLSSPAAIDRLLELLRAQDEAVDALHSEADSDSDKDLDFVRCVYLHEMERVKFVLQSYLRTRLYKIEQKTLAILKSDEYRANLSETELAFAQRFNEIVQQNYERSFLLDSLPPSLQGMDDPAIVGAPDLNQAVFFRTKVDYGDHLLPKYVVDIAEGGASLPPKAVS
ncbi:hypothetical protein BDR26DRAFT_922458 [Obelidium mucronatum]|nr:hypothetical protein BDR26DRAFT_922458 [Obelidium mucronatum]